MTDQTGIGDFIFGTLATTEDRVRTLLDSRRGISEPLLVRDADGTIRVTLTAGPDAPVESVTLYYTTDGSDPRPDVPGTLERAFHEYRPQWDTLLFAYLRTFEATIPAGSLPETGLLRYRVQGISMGGAVYETGRRYSLLLEAHPVPEWLASAVIYHVFVDRFATTDSAPFAQHDDYGQFFGGTLRGIIQKLDYLAELGATCLWLSPVFPSPSHHGYDATDFTEIEPRLGTKDDLRELVQAAHARQMHVLLDFVPNHVSETHPFFVSARTDPASPYRDYFTFTDWPDEYETFFGVKSLPQINNENAAARKYVIDSALYWMREFGVDGYRLDYAYGPSHDFWAEYYAAVKAQDPQSVHFGEIVETPELLASYEGRMDGALDFHFLAAVRKTFAFDTMTVDAFDDWLTRHQAYFRGRQFALPTFLDNHDLNRFLWAASGDTRRQKIAALVQFTLPATPIIYYGSEAGLRQRRDIRQGSLAIMEESRVPMAWDAPDADMLSYYRQLTALRREIGGALQGSRETLIADAQTGHYVYGYYAIDGTDFDGEMGVLVLINHSEDAAELVVDAPGVWRDLFSDAQVFGSPALVLIMAAETGTALVRVS